MIDSKGQCPKIVPPSQHHQPQQQQRQQHHSAVVARPHRSRRRNDLLVHLTSVRDFEDITRIQSVIRRPQAFFKESVTWRKAVPYAKVIQCTRPKSVKKWSFCGTRDPWSFDKRSALYRHFSVWRALERILDTPSSTNIQRWSSFWLRRRQTLIWCGSFQPLWSFS